MSDEKPRRGPGHPPFEPTPEQRDTVSVMRSNGDPIAIIARTIGCDEKTLRKHFEVELREGKEQVIAKVGASVVRAALNGNVYAAKYWLSTHGGPEWKVVEGRQIGGMDGPPITVAGDARVVVYLPHNNREPVKPD